ncbi:MAG: hypothetical protein ACI9UV_000356, partial [Algoriphagus sp.]
HWNKRFCPFLRLQPQSQVLPIRFGLSPEEHLGLQIECLFSGRKLGGKKRFQLKISRVFSLFEWIGFRQRKPKSSKDHKVHEFAVEDFSFIRCSGFSILDLDRRIFNPKKLIIKG